MQALKELRPQTVTPAPAESQQQAPGCPPQGWCPNDGRSVEWLRIRIGLTQSGTVRLVDRLSDRGLLQRGPSTGRGVPLHLTAGGHEVLERWHQARESAVDGLLTGVPAGQRPELVQAIAAALMAEERVRPQADATCRTCSWPECGEDCPVDRSVPDPDAAPMG